MRDQYVIDTETREIEAMEAALRGDYEHLNGWTSESWSWLTLEVAPLCDCCGTPRWEEAVSLGAVESHRDDLDDLVRELYVEMTWELNKGGNDA
jgi:hypothetical protein